MPKARITLKLDPDQIPALHNAADYFDLGDREFLQWCLDKGIAQALGMMAEELGSGKEEAGNIAESDLPF